MNAAAVAKHYGSLTPDERFRLILSAGARGDDAEQERLRAAGGRISLSLPDHAPHAHAFDELALLVFIELLDTAADYLEAFHRSDYEGELETEEEPEDEPAGATDTNENDADPAGNPWQGPTGQRRLDLALATGYVLAARAAGWKRFCDGMGVPPYAIWECLPGFDRLQRATALAEHAALVPEGMLQWLNATRPRGEPENRKLVATPDWYAEALVGMYRKRVAWWGGADVGERTA